MAKTKKIIGFFGGFPMGYFTGVFLAGAETDIQGIIKSIIFQLGNWQIHLHHWFISLLILITLFFSLRRKETVPVLLLPILIGFLSGCILQGILCYSDWHQILIKIK